MFYVLQDESTAARRRVPILLTDAATGTTAQTGVATTTIFPYVNINGGAFAVGAGTIGEAGFGQYYYEMDPSEVATLGLAGIHITAAGCRDYDAITQVAAFNMYGVGSGISAYDVWAYTITNTGQSADDTLANASQSASSADANASLANTQTVNIALQVWGDDLAAGGNAPYASGTAGTILYDLSLGGTGISAADVWNYTLGTTVSADATITQIASETNTISSLPGSTASSVWSYTLPNSQFAENALVSAASGATAGDVWEYDISSITTSGTAGSQLNLAASPSGSGISAADVWDFNITGFGGTNSAAVYATQTNFTVGNIETYVSTQTPQDVWTYAGIEGRTITGGLADTVTSLTNPANITTGSMTGIAGTVWSAASRTITGGTATTVTNPIDITTASMSGVASTVWNSLVASYNTNGTFGKNVLRADAANKVGDVTLYSSGGVNGVDADVHRISNDTAAATALKDILTGVGSTITGNITGNLSGSVGSVSAAVSVATASMTGIAGTVWNAATRTITGGTITTVSDKTGYSLSASQTFNVTGNITGNVSGSVGSVSGAVGSVTSPVSLATASMTGIAGTVWATNISAYTSPSAGYSLFNATAGGGITAGDVWSYATRTLTSGGSGISAGDVWNYVLSDSNTAGADLVTAASGAGISAGDVWTYGSRTITGGIADTVTTITNRSGFAITGGTITTVSDKTGYSLSGSQSFNLTGNITGNLSGSVGSVSSGVTVSTNNDKTGYALSTAGVNAVQNGLSTLTQAQVGTEVDSSLLDVGLTSTVTGRIDATVSSRLSSASYTAPPTEAAIAGTVWGYNSRTLTSGAGATAGDVWNYPTRSLTSGAGITVNAATNIINGPYFVKSNVDGQDGTLDVIRGMVQDIQLTVTDAFQNPFDTTALGLLVNFYDQAGTLTTSYATTELYGPAGLVQFTLDTAVTANEGRYNLILSAAGSGNTIKFGPLQTLVRPF